MSSSPDLSGSDSNDAPRYGTQHRGRGGAQSGSKRPRSGPLTWPSRKKPRRSDPLVRYGRHFGRTVFAFANVYTLLQAGIEADSDHPPKTPEDEQTLRVFWKLTRMIPGFGERLLNSNDDELDYIASLISQGISGARSDDTRSLKGAIVDWIVPKGESLRPPLSRNSKYDRGYNHEVTGRLLCPVNMDWSKPENKKALKNKEIIPTGQIWPAFLYKDEHLDPSDPWNGLFRNRLLVLGFKHIFTSPSSTEDTPRATRSGNAAIHGMSRVTRASIAYVATQVRFALHSATAFSRSDKETDSEVFYQTVLELLNDPEEEEEVAELMTWWNKQVFPTSLVSRQVPPANSALSLIKARRAAIKKARQDSAQGSKQQELAAEEEEEDEGEGEGGFEDEDEDEDEGHHGRGGVDVDGDGDSDEGDVDEDALTTGGNSRATTSKASSDSHQVRKKQKTVAKKTVAKAKKQGEQGRSDRGDSKGKGRADGAAKHPSNGEKGLADAVFNGTARGIRLILAPPKTTRSRSRRPDFVEGL